jgi:hypothetical protein
MSKLASLIPLSIEGVMQLHRLRNVLGKLRPHPEPAMEVALEITRRLDEQDAHLPAITINPLPTQCLMAQDGIAMLRPLLFACNAKTMAVSSSSSMEKLLLEPRIVI